MKKGIIPVFLACMMLVLMCTRDPGGDHGAIDQDKDFEYGKNSYTQTQPPGYRESSSKEGSDIKEATRRSGIRERRKEDKTGKTVVTSSKKAGNKQGEAAVASDTNESGMKAENRERKPGDLLVKPRVDVPEVK